MRRTRSLSHVYAALKSRDISFDEMDELALHFAAYYGWAKASHLNDEIGRQKERVLEEWRTEASGAAVSTAVAADCGLADRGRADHPVLGR